jgi:transcriptional regulator with XRE-family HTH domain
MPSNNLKKLREAKGLSQLELANAVNLTQGAISYIERTGKTPREDNQKAIAKALCCSVSTVFPDLTPKWAKNYTRKMTQGAALNRVSDIMLGRSPSELGRIVTMLEAAFPR